MDAILLSLKSQWNKSLGDAGSPSCLFMFNGKWQSNKGLHEASPFFFAFRSDTTNLIRRGRQPDPNNPVVCSRAFFPLHARLRFSPRVAFRRGRKCNAMQGVPTGARPLIPHPTYPHTSILKHTMSSLWNSCQVCFPPVKCGAISVSRVKNDRKHLIRQTPPCCEK